MHASIGIGRPSVEDALQTTISHAMRFCQATIKESEIPIQEQSTQQAVPKSEYVLLHFSVTTSVRCLQRLLQVHEFSLSDA